MKSGTEYKWMMKNNQNVLSMYFKNTNKRRKLSGNDIDEKQCDTPSDTNKQCKDINYLLHMNRIKTVDQLMERYFCDGLIVNVIGDNDDKHTYFCVVCNKWIFYKDGGSETKTWHTDCNVIKLKVCDHFLNTLKNKQHLKLLNNPNEKHVNYERECQIMKNLGRIALNNTKDYGSDSKYERLIFQAFELRVYIGQRLHSRFVLVRFKKIFYKLVKF